MPVTIRDRTQEFLATIDTFQHHMNHQVTKPIPSNAKETLPHEAIQQSSKVNNLGNQTAETIENVQQKINELVSLSKSTSNLRDERPKITKLLMSIKTDIKNIGTDIKTMKTFIAQSFDETSSSHQCMTHHKALVDVLESRYNGLKESFGSAYEITTKYLQKQKMERRKFGLSCNYRSVSMNRLPRGIFLCVCFR